ncbi:TPA: hypothetical protein N0F65_002026 [Lagenidium giganteum]|uniref:Sodium/hydrogen exchanger n=1 Tax=Lagenidium giganteum TaxID=4803 RepID=A0AAV2YZ96_9STRA|nr:TPA: hypothetical protein N0F65_002026 [Lagenidium giganteum]
MSSEIQIEHSESKTNHEWELSFFFALFLTLLMISIIVSNHVTHKLHWHFMPEAAATIGVGMVASIICMMKSDSITTSLTAFDPNIFFVGLLPPIIFNSGYTMKRRYFFNNITPILTYSIFGTMIMSIVTGTLVYIVGRIGWMTKFSLAESLTFGSLISATDTVSTLAVFQELHVDPTLFYLVFGESSLNDAVAICLFTTFSRFIGYSYSLKPMLLAIVEFALVFVGSTLVGIAFGVIPALLFKHTNLRSCLLHEVSVYVMFAYLPFLISQIFEMSGVVSIIFAGIALKHYASPNLSIEAQEVCSRVFNTIAHVTETAVFLNLGLSVFALHNGYNFMFIFWTLLFCLIARACHVYPLTHLLNKRKDAPKITMNQQHMIWYSGLRGAVAFALAKSFPGEKQTEVIATTMIIILVTIFIMGGGTVAMLKMLDIPRLTPEEELELDKSVKPHTNMPLLQFDNKYLIPLLTNLCQYGDNDSPDKTKRKSFSRSSPHTDEEEDNDGDEVIEVFALAIDRVVEEAFEVEKFVPFNGWVFDRFCDRKGNTYFELTAAAAEVAGPSKICAVAADDKDHLEIGVLPTVEWMWQHEWMIDQDTGDQEGWSYGSTIARINRRLAEGTTKSKPEYYHFVRRRRWIRTRIRKPLDGELDDDDEEHVGDAHTVHNLRRSRIEPVKRFYRVYRDSMLAHFQFGPRPRLANFIKIDFSDDCIEREGWLGKRGSFSRSWKLRYFLLRADTGALICLRDTASLVQVSETLIDRHTSVVVEDTPMRHQFQFLVVNGEHKLRLNAVDDNCRKAWLSAISELIVRSRASFLAAEDSDNVSSTRSRRLMRMRSSLATDDGSTRGNGPGMWNGGTGVREHQRAVWRPYSLISSTMHPRSRANRVFREEYLHAFEEELLTLITQARSFVLSNVDVLEENLQIAEEWLSSAIAGVPVEDIEHLRSEITAALIKFEDTSIDLIRGPSGSVLLCNRLRKELYAETKRLNDTVLAFTPPAIVAQQRVKKKSAVESPKKRQIPTDWFIEPTVRPQQRHSTPSPKQGVVPRPKRSSVGSSSNTDPSRASTATTTHAVSYLKYEEMPSVLCEGHPELPSGVNSYVVLVHEKDLGSLIGFTLCSDTYVDSVESHFGGAINIREELQAEETTAEQPDDSKHTTSFAIMKRSRYLQQLRANGSPHADIRFWYETSSAKHDIRCVAFFAAQFHALRQLIGVGNVDFVNSIAKSKRWETSGGKSGAFFSMTHDKRYVLKGIPLSEFNMFLHMAPQYFRYMAIVTESRSPTVITKILGLFKVSHSKKLHKHTTYVVVMENITYGFVPGQMYDLKGILRRRYNVNSNESDRGSLTSDDSPAMASHPPTHNPVLMDGNLAEIIPIPVRQADWKKVSDAIDLDTNFLCKAGVIDYSMLLFFDETKRRVVVGVIDYLHQFDFLKKMESTSKASLTFRNPTIISPLAYQQRLVNAMRRYLVGIDVDLELRIKKRNHRHEGDNPTDSNGKVNGSVQICELLETDEEAHPTGNISVAVPSSKHQQHGCSSDVASSTSNGRPRGRSLPMLCAGDEVSYDSTAFLAHSEGEDFSSESSDEICLKSASAVIASLMPELDDDS